ncbi:hypothetical protein [Nostoc sp. UHCC 0251]|uniref:hypothetical protein n=1 Tax=Nostoc sp. UHCC 0251 TaxID=3110240 RepID=UPI002B1ED531|nr:hypothetical protein [Nostoc sp. UHCC 0251]MEA5626887.1 hypothetical protein [Nostoc sp. UHCC 0251]
MQKNLPVKFLEDCCDRMGEGAIAKNYYFSSYDRDKIKKENSWCYSTKSLTIYAKK